MDKIVIIGSAGSGKSTLARKMYSIFEIKVHHLDRVFWQPGWKEKPRKTRIDILNNLVQKKRWIIEGTYLSSSKPRLEMADTIIVLDIHPVLCLLRIIRRYRPFLRLLRLIKRQREQEFLRRDLPFGCTEKLTLFLILKVIVFPFRGKKTLQKNLLNYDSKDIIWLHSPKEVEDFLAHLEPQNTKKKQLSKPFSASSNRQPVAAK